MLSKVNVFKCDQVASQELLMSAKSQLLSLACVSFSSSLTDVIFELKYTLLF